MLIDDVTEGTLSQRPFIVRRTVRWGDCDPAGIAYTGRFSDYVLGAAHLFRRQLERDAGSSTVAGEGVETPCKSLSFVFHAPLRPNDAIDLHVSVGSLHTSSYDLVVSARRPDGRPVFDSVVTPICIRLADRTRVPLSPSLRALLQPYRAAEAGVT